jgi:hypothetical protein
MKQKPQLHFKTKFYHEYLVEGQMLLMPRITHQWDLVQLLALASLYIKLNTYLSFDDAMIGSVLQ